jgi:transposase
MTLALLTMSRRELDRAESMQQIRERGATQAQVAERLGLSVRQVERLYRSYKACGAAGLISKKRGRPSLRRLPDAMRAEALAIVRERYADFGPTLAREKLTESHGVRVSTETLRQWMIAEGIWLPRVQRAARAHPPRHRRACLGELVQIDGCDHEWFESRAPRCVLLVYVDDATGRLMHLRFVRSESTFDYFESTRRYIEEHGKPVAFYSDKASTFRVNAKQPRGGDRSTQFSRAMDELNIDILCANSPQAKGRVERAHQTLQDRLVKELRLRGISTMDDANHFLPWFIADYNRRFAREPASRHNAHRALRPNEDLGAIFRWKEDRKLSHNLTVHYNRVLYLVEESPEALKLRGKRVEVHEMLDGAVHIRHRGLELPATPFRKQGQVRQQDVADNKYLATILERLRRDQIARDQKKLEGRGTLRERRCLLASIEASSAPP